MDPHELPPDQASAIRDLTSLCQRCGTTSWHRTSWSRSARCVTTWTA
jgi:hypothetical protein